MHIDIEKKGCQDQSLWDAVFQMSQPASLAVTGSKGETSIPNKICLSGRSLSSLQVRSRCQTVSYAAVRSTNTAPAFFFALKESSMFCVGKTT